MIAKQYCIPDEWRNSTMVFLMTTNASLYIIINGLAEVPFEGILIEVHKGKII